LSIFGGFVNLDRSAVSQNLASGPIGGQGGGIVIGKEASLTLSNGPVTNNSTRSDGGGIYGLLRTVVSFSDSPVRDNHPNDGVNVPGCKPLVIHLAPDTRGSRSPTSHAATPAIRSSAG
jgi:hypothetical protein